VWAVDLNGDVQSTKGHKFSVATAGGADLSLKAYRIACVQSPESIPILIVSGSNG
jgi:hypothetical protein